MNILKAVDLQKYTDKEKRKFEPLTVSILK